MLLAHHRVKYLSVSRIEILVLGVVVRKLVRLLFIKGVSSHSVRLLRKLRFVLLAERSATESRILA